MLQNVNVLNIVEFSLIFSHVPLYRYYGFTCDPIDVRRVWAITRGADTASTSSTMKRSFKVPAQAVSITFDKEGKVTKFTMGHIIDKSESQKTRKKPSLHRAFGKATSGLSSLFTNR